MIHNFAGIDGICAKIIFSVLRIDPGLRSDIIDGLRSADLTIAKPLADNLFRAAIVEGNDHAVTLVLETTAGRLNEIDLNQIICQWDARLYTPLALASFRHRVQIVRQLLKFGAKVRVSSEKLQNTLFVGDALAAMVQSWSSKHNQDVVQDKAEVLQTMKLLIANGAIMTASSLRDEIRLIRQSHELIGMLVKSAPEERHFELFESVPDDRDWPALCHIVWELEN